MCKRWETDANLVSRSYSCEHVTIWIIAESLLLYIFILTRIRSYWNSQGKNSLGLVSGTKRVCLFSQTLFRFGNSSIKKAFFQADTWMAKKIIPSTCTTLIFCTASFKYPEFWFFSNNCKWRNRSSKSLHTNNWYFGSFSVLINIPFLFLFSWMRPN